MLKRTERGAINTPAAWPHGDYLGLGTPKNDGSKSGHFGALKQRESWHNFIWIETIQSANLPRSWLTLFALWCLLLHHLDCYINAPIQKNQQKITGYLRCSTRKLFNFFRVVVIRNNAVLSKCSFQRFSTRFDTNIMAFKKGRLKDCHVKIHVNNCTTSKNNPLLNST